MRIILTKAHVKGYTKKDGTFVAPHLRRSRMRTNTVEGTEDVLLRNIRAMGLTVDESRKSGMSASRYIYVSQGVGEPDDEGMYPEYSHFKIRISDHKLPISYKVQHGDADFEVSPNGMSHDETSGNWHQALAWLSEKTGKPMTGAALRSHNRWQDDMQAMNDRRERERSDASKRYIEDVRERRAPVLKEFEQWVSGLPDDAEIRVSKKGNVSSMVDGEVRMFGAKPHGYSVHLNTVTDARDFIRSEKSLYERVMGQNLIKAQRSTDWEPPTEAQAKAGNYKKPRVQWNGLEIAIENPAGSVREGKGWRTKMKYDYGYICRSEAVDGDEVDVYLGPDLDTATVVYVVHQRKQGDWKAYDEDKAMIGFADEAAARKAYLAHYDDPRFLGPVTAMTVDEFIKKVKATKDKPAMIKAIMFIKGGAPGAPGLHKEIRVDKNGRRVAHWVRSPRSKYKDPKQLSFDFEKVYENIETRPGTTEAQIKIGKEAARDVQRRILGFRVDRKQIATVLGSRFTKDFVENGYVTLVGQKVKTSRDLAVLAQVYRDPRFETARAFFVRDGVVVGETAYTSRLPGMVNFSMSFFDQLKNDKETFGAEKYYFLHNHPSGSSEPSYADKAMTAALAERVPGFYGHVVIDHNEYSVIGPTGHFHTIKDKSLEGIDFNENPELDHDLLGRKLLHSSHVMALGKALQKQGELERPVLVLTSGKEAEASMIMSFPTDAIPGYGQKHHVAQAKGWLRRVSRKVGSASHRFVVVSDKDFKNHHSGLLQLFLEGVVTDVVSTSGHSLSASSDGKRVRDTQLMSTTKPARRVVVGGKQESRAELKNPDFGTP